jgi:ABC-type branched-subunit amino acid transport system ATPase component
MDEAGAIARSENGQSRASVLLTISGVTRSFYGVAALRGVDLEIRQGTLTGLIGPNGAGKSTLFNIVSGQFAPDAGAVSFAGREITGNKPHRIVHQGLIRTFQLARGFPKLTVFQHLMLYGPRQAGESLWAAIVGTAAARHREQELAERAFATARRLRLDAVIDNPVTALAGGQKKLVEIGRALMAEPRMILLDEPMAGVNPTLTGEIAEHLIALNKAGITICLIEHDMALIRELCDPVIVMAEGRTLTTGSFTEVAADMRVQEAYLGRRH